MTQLTYLLALAMLASPVIAAAQARPAPPASAPDQPAVMVFIVPPKLYALCQQGNGCQVFQVDILDKVFAEHGKKERAAGRAEGCKGPNT
jgi:hypothetical protein